ncbi:MAG: hypothetical protein H6551_06345 [Chitinophagales bacterium]|nr:hypothetical protein [Chitinophagaceae bacterium]MCB9064748.1 hypothetical protein [Chitinophagales bacterium]
MRYSIKQLSFLLLTTLLTLSTVTAQAKKKKMYKPTAILVQLKAEQRKISELEKNNRTGSANMIKEDAAQVRSRMIKDFTDNFDYCPVYYFMDTDLDKIKRYDFDGVLLDKDGNIVTSASITSGDSTFYIAYYGMPAPAYKDDEDKGKRKSSNVTNEALVLTDNRYNQVETFWRNKIFEPTISEYNYESAISTTVTYKRSADMLNHFFTKRSK